MKNTKRNEIKQAILSRAKKLVIWADENYFVPNFAEFVDWENGIMLIPAKKVSTKRLEKMFDNESAIFATKLDTALAHSALYK